jgi:hypothetical protein
MFAKIVIVEPDAGGIEQLLWCRHCPHPVCGIMFFVAKAVPPAC